MNPKDFDLSIEQDNFIHDRLEGCARYVIKLNSGYEVFQDDDRDGIFPASTWERLGNYCRTTGDYITGMYLQFRSHIEHIESNADGYYFAKSALSGFGMTHTWHFFAIGVLKDGHLTVSTWKIPELLIHETEQRDPAKAGICLIRKSNV